MKQVLMIEDDKALSNGIRMALTSIEVSISQCYQIKTAKEMIEHEDYDLIILDINLPDGNGLDLLQEVKKTKNLPVIILTANDMEIDIVSGLELGADDYITKPFSLAVLRARVNTQLRKQNQLVNSSYQQDEFVFDFDHMVYLKNSQVIELSKTEQRLLKMLIEHKGITLQRSLLVDRIWTDGAEYVDENALSVTIKRLRDKLEENPSKPKYIKTIYGIGYQWVVNESV